MPPPVLNAAEVDALLRSSENRTTMYQGKGHDPEGRGHSLARHYLITNLGLVERRDTEPRNGKIAYFSAYITRTDMVEAARELLNSPAGFWAREQLFDVAATAARPRGSRIRACAPSSILLGAPFVSATPERLESCRFPAAG